MDFKRARNDEQVANRQEEIINACCSIYANGNYDSITFGKISEITSISRPSIYNYYITREEILLDVLEKEYFTWYENLKNNFNENIRLNKKDLCELLAKSFISCDIFLRLLSIQYSIIEKNCSFEKLTQFKMNIQPILNSVENIIAKTFPKTNSNKRNNFICLLFSVVSSLYEMSTPSEIQLKASKIANREYKSIDFETLCYETINLLCAIL